MMLLQQQQQRRLWDAAKATTTKTTTGSSTATTTSAEATAEVGNKLDLSLDDVAAKRRGIRQIQRKDQEDTRHACRRLSSISYP